VSTLAIAAPPDDRVLLPFGRKAYDFAFRAPKDDCWLNFLEGSVRSAKTWATYPKILSLCRYPVKGWRVFTGVTKETIYRNVLNDLFNIIGQHNYGYNRQSGELDMFGSKWLVIGAKDEGSEKVLRGITIGVGVGDELTLQSRSFVLTFLNRMSVENARFYATMNTDTPYHYLKTDFLDNKKLRESGRLWSEHFLLEDNPNLPPMFKADLEAIYPTGSLYHQRFVLGLWVTGEGSIYKDVWSEDLLYDDDSFPEIKNLRRSGAAIERTVSVDCGVDHVQVYLDWIDDGRTLYCDREYWWDSHETHRQKTDRQYREDLEIFLKDAPGARTILPPECASFAAELTQAGIWFMDADNEVLDGIKMVASMMALKRIKFHRHRAKNTIQQLQTYLWNPKASLRGVEEPLKTKDDGPDAVRYKVKTDVPAGRLAA
jgi:PBSX family phage terminase large subunit